MEMLYDIALWVNELVDQMGVWAAAPAFVGAGLVIYKMKNQQTG